MTVTAPAPAVLTAAPAAGPARPYLRHGRLLTAGAAAWAVSTALTGVDPGTETADLLVFGVGSGTFQLGLLALLRVMWLTQGLGTGRLARTFLRIEAAMVLLAIGSTLADTFAVSDLSQPGWALLDAFWPFSMMGMFAIGVRVAIAGRWSGAARFWPMVAESWVVVCLPTLLLFGATAAAAVSCVHLLLGYGVLGVLVSAKTS